MSKINSFRSNAMLVARILCLAGSVLLLSGCGVIVAGISAGGAPYSFPANKQSPRYYELRAKFTHEGQPYDIVHHWHCEHTLDVVMPDGRHPFWEESQQSAYKALANGALLVFSLPHVCGDDKVENYVTDLTYFPDMSNQCVYFLHRKEPGLHAENRLLRAMFFASAGRVQKQKDTELDERESSFIASLRQQSETDPYRYKTVWVDSYELPPDIALLVLEVAHKSLDEGWLLYNKTKSFEGVDLVLKNNKKKLSWRGRLLMSPVDRVWRSSDNQDKEIYVNSRCFPEMSYKSEAPVWVDVAGIRIDAKVHEMLFNRKTNMLYRIVTPTGYL